MRSIYAVSNHILIYNLFESERSTSAETIDKDIQQDDPTRLSTCPLRCWLIEHRLAVIRRLDKLAGTQAAAVHHFWTSNCLRAIFAYLLVVCARDPFKGPSIPPVAIGPSQLDNNSLNRCQSSLCPSSCFDRRTIDVGFKIRIDCSPSKSSSIYLSMRAWNFSDAMSSIDTTSALPLKFQNYSRFCLFC